MCDCERVVEAAIRLWDRRYELELCLAGAVLANLKGCLPAALEAGACMALFDRWDMRLVWAGCVLYGDRGREWLLPLLRDALVAEGLWDHDDDREYLRGIVWNEAALIDFSHARWLIAEVKIMAQELRSVVRRIQRAERCWRLLPRILDPQLDIRVPGFDSDPALRRKVMKPRKAPRAYAVVRIEERCIPARQPGDADSAGGADTPASAEPEVREAWRLTGPNIPPNVIAPAEAGRQRLQRHADALNKAYARGWNARGKR